MDHIDKIYRDQEVDIGTNILNLNIKSVSVR